MVTTWPPRATVSQHRRLRKYDLPDPSRPDRGDRRAGVGPRAVGGVEQHGGAGAAVERDAEQQARGVADLRAAERAAGRHVPGQHELRVVAADRRRGRARQHRAQQRRPGRRWGGPGRTPGARTAARAAGPVLQVGQVLGGDREQDGRLQLGLGGVGAQLGALVADGVDGARPAGAGRRSARRRTRRPGPRGRGACVAPWPGRRRCRWTGAARTSRPGTRPGRRSRATRRPRRGSGSSAACRPWPARSGSCAAGPVDADVAAVARAVLVVPVAALLHDPLAELGEDAACAPPLLFLGRRHPAAGVQVVAGRHRRLPRLVERLLAHLASQRAGVEPAQLAGGDGAERHVRAQLHLELAGLAPPLGELLRRDRAGPQAERRVDVGRRPGTSRTSAGAAGERDGHVVPPPVSGSPPATRRWPGTRPSRPAGCRGRCPRPCRSRRRASRAARTPTGASSRRAGR